MSLFKDITLKPMQKAAIIAFCIFICFVVGQFVAGTIAQLTEPEIFSKIKSAETPHANDINLIKILQFVSAIFTFVIPPFIIASVIGGNTLTYLNINRSPSISYYIMIPIFMLCLMPFMNIVIQLNDAIILPQSLSGLETKLREMEESSKSMMTVILSGNTNLDLLINLILIAVIPALGEELLFRGVIQKHLSEWIRNPHIAIFIAAFIFSAVHFQFYGFIPRLLLGMIFGYLVYLSGSIWPAIFAHFFNNAMAILAYHYIHKGDIPENTQNFGTQPNDYFFVIVGLIIAILIARIAVKNKNIM
jgi:uncharacterized protein